MKKILWVVAVLMTATTYAQDETVNGSLNINGITRIYTDSDPPLSFYNTDNSWQYMQFFQSNVRKAYVGLDNNNKFVFGKENGGSFYFTGANVGIGLNNPLDKLHVDGNLRISSGSLLTYGTGQFYDSADAQLRLRSSDTWNGIDFQDVGGRDFLWFNGQHKTFAIGGGGSNVAGKKLHVEGGASIGATYKQNTVPANGLAVEGRLGVGVYNPLAKIEVSDPARNYAILLGNENVVAFKRSDGLKVYGIGHSQGEFTIGRLPGLGDNAGTSLNIATGGSFTKFSHGGNERMRLTSAGNLGIGIASPVEKLEVNGNMRIIGYNSRLYMGGVGGTTFGMAYSAQYPDYGIFYSEGNPDYVSISPNGNATNGVLNVYGDGKVGIGTTSPTAKLHLYNGDANTTFKDLYANLIVEGMDSRMQLISSNAGSNGSSISLTNENSSWTLHQKTSALNNRFDIGFRESTGIEDVASLQTPMLSILKDGKVGIGTSSPDTTLDVNGIISASSELRSKSNNPGFLFDESDVADKNWHMQVNGGDFKIYEVDDARTNWNQKMVIQNTTGNVGIGTTSPEEKMVVQVTDTHRYVKYKAPNGEERFQFYVGGTGNAANLSMFDNNGTSRNVLIAAGGTTYFNGGNVGIGTTAPDAKLAVNGTIHSREVKVDLIGWPDYVFEKEYKLPTLAEVEKHIEEKGHLKDIPSAKEVAKNGILLGQMDSKLLQKIEELTLYTIQQEKEIQKLKEQNKRIAKLEKLVQQLLEEKK